MVGLGVELFESRAACPQLPCPPPPPGRFLRFPGGCYVEGDWLRAAFRWKTALGGNEERPGHFNR